MNPTGKPVSGKADPAGPTARRMLAWLATAEFLGMTLWFSATAAAPAIAAEFGLSPAGSAWLTMAVQAGFVAGTLLSALMNLPDVLNARRLFAAGCALAAAANAGVAWSDGPTQAIACRAITGMALAWVYPPGMKVAAGWFQDRRGTALGIVVGALTIGSAFPHLLASLALGVDWRPMILTASGLALAAGVLILTMVGDGPYVAETAQFDPRAAARVFTTRGTRLATLGYLGHMWELYAMWAWIAAFATASFVERGAPLAGRSGALTAFAAIASGAIGCVAAGIVADRLGNARIAAWAMVVSSACSALAGFAYGSPAALHLLAVVWGFAIVADSAQFSALIAQYSPREHVGTALTVQLCSGFLLTLITIRLVPVAAAYLGWRWAFLVLVPGPALGAVAMWALEKRGQDLLMDAA